MRSLQWGIHTISLEKTTSSKMLQAYKTEEMGGQLMKFAVGRRLPQEVPRMPAPSSLIQ
jgi:hypothetical protein